MTDRRRILGKWLIMAMFVALAGAGLRGDDYALLVGVTRYPALPMNKWLKGPTNDVAMMHALLTGNNFGMDAGRITTLAGWPQDPAKRPTRANIEQAFRDLRGKTKPGDSVFVLLSGHGSQQPDIPTSGDIEPDGLDEIFLPADIGDWDATNKTVRNAIVDDDMHAWISMLVSNGVSVMAIFDSCNSGTMTRDATIPEASVRRVDMASLVPESARKGVVSRGTEKTGPSGSKTNGLPSGAVAIYAAQPYESTFEMELPPGSGKTYGVLTYMIARALGTAQEKLTYREMMDRVITLYRVTGVAQPTPFMEGPDGNRFVLGSSTRKDTPYFLLLGFENENGHAMDAGALQGVAQGTIFEVFPPAGMKDAGKSIGYVEVVRCDPLASFVKPIAYEGRAAPNPGQLGIESRCRIAFENFEQPPLRVVLQIPEEDASAAATTPGKGLRTGAVHALRRIRVNYPNLIAVTEDAARAEWVLRVRPDRADLIPCTGWSMLPPSKSRNRSTVPDRTAFKLVSPEKGEEFAASLESAVLRIGRARRLLYIATKGSIAVGAPGSTRVRAEVLKYDSTGTTNGVPLASGSSGRIVHGGDTIAFRVSNPGDHPIDVTILFIDADFGITAVFPEPGIVEDNRLFPGQSRLTSRLEVTTETAGQENVVVFAVRATRDRVD
ncbi:MAG: caspase family protein, partial [Kiritimatiellia bacterium]